MEVSAGLRRMGASHIGSFYCSCAWRGTESKSQGKGERRSHLPTVVILQSSGWAEEGKGGGKIIPTFLSVHPSPIGTSYWPDLTGI